MRTWLEKMPAARTQSERDSERPLQHLVVLGLRARWVDDLGEIEAKIDVLAVGHTHADANAAAGLSERLAWLDAVAAGGACIVKPEQSHLDFFPAEFSAQLRGIEFEASRIPFVVGNLANIEAAHRVGTAVPELLAGHQPIIRE